MLWFLQFLGYVAVMLAVVPLYGFLVSGSWRAAWRYTKDWGRVMGLIIAAAILLALIVGAIPASG
jgi:hypothetical protein